MMISSADKFRVAPEGPSGGPSVLTLAAAFILAALVTAWGSPVSAAEAILSWNANTESDLAGYHVHYGTTSGSYTTVIPVGLVTSYTVTGLGPGTFYFAVTADDTAGLRSGFSTEVSKIVPDTTAPAISAVAAGVITASGATVTWTTNEPATSLVEYGLTTSYGASSALNSTRVTAHSRTVSGLSAASLYHYRVISTDAAGNTAVSADYTFTTATAADTTPPVLSNIAAVSVTSSGATITWTTNEASTTQVNYGTTTAYGASTALNSSLFTAHSATLSGLQPATVYHFRVRSADAAGNLALSGDTTFTTLAAPDTTPPALSNVTSGSVSSAGATITWTTNEASTTQVNYGTTTAYGASTALNSSLVTAHSAGLSGLQAATVYHFRVRSADAAGNLALSGDATFTTLAAPDTTPPTISGVVASSTGATSTVITWSTNEPSTSVVDYGLGTSYGSTSTDATLVTSHSRTLIGLTASTTYHFRVRSADAAGNASSSTDFVFTTSALPDTTPPTLSNITAGSLTSSGATITWTTNEASTTQVNYGTTTAYGASTALNSSLFTAHSATLSGLQAATVYHFRVRSADAAGNLALSGDTTFTTLAAPDTTPPTISGVVASSTGATSTVITWSTNEPSTSVVDYGLGTSYGSTSTDATLVTSHSRTLIGLTASTTYHFRVRSADAAGNASSSTDFVFTTSALPDTTPPTLSNITAGSLTSSGATITWTTNEASTTQVNYGTTTAYGASTALNSSLFTAHSATLSGLQAATVYHFRVRSADAAGNLALSGDTTFTTLAAPDTTPPALSNEGPTGILGVLSDAMDTAGL